jgi:hypothetical protein
MRAKQDSEVSALHEGKMNACSGFPTSHLQQYH